MSKEARTRIKISDLHKEAGWRFFDDANGRANIALENNVKITRPTSTRVFVHVQVTMDSRHD